MGDLKGTVDQILAPLDRKLKDYETLYKHLHQHGELSRCEKETSILIAEKLQAFSTELDIKTGIGGYGLVAILKNGPGRTVLIRADMDALPVREKTGLAYQSNKSMQNAEGIEKPVMHACGHDFHVTCGLAAADALINGKKHWAGTCIFLFQPAEESLSGAQAMIEDGLFDPNRHGCPIPDILLGQHVISLPAGFVAVRSGPIMAASDNFRIVIFGRGGHGSSPHRTIDPVITACSIVLRLQTIVSREVPPVETAVLTVGSIKAGDVPNVIPEEAEIKVNMRTYNPDIRDRMVKALHRIVKAECEAGNCPQPPIIDLFESAPLTENDPEVHSMIDKTFASHFGKRYMPDMPAIPGSEDFSNLGRSIKRPYCFWFFGGYPLDPEHLEKPFFEILSQSPGNHNSSFAPIINPTLQTGAQAMVVATLGALGTHS